MDVPVFHPEETVCDPPELWATLSLTPVLWLSVWLLLKVSEVPAVWVKLFDKPALSVWVIERPWASDSVTLVEELVPWLYEVV